MVSSGSFSRGAALAAVVVATEQLGYTKLSAEQEEVVLHLGRVHLSSNRGWKVPVLWPFTYGNSLTANVNTVTIVDLA